MPGEQLGKAAAARHARAVARAEEALRALDREGARDLVSGGRAASGRLASVALHPAPAARRDPAAARPRAVPARQRASEASLRQRVESLRAENQRLREENASLKQELAIAYGQQRAASAGG